MKTPKKIWMGMGILLLMIFGGLFFSSRTALAATSSPADITNCVKNLQFVNIAEVDCTFIPAGQSGATTVKFIDNKPDDSGNSHAYKMNYQQQGDFFCQSGDVTNSTDNGGLLDRFYNIGVTVPGNGPLSQDNAGKNIKLVFNEGFQDPSTASCVYPSGYNKDNLPNNTISGAATQNVSKLLLFSSTGIQPLDGVTDSSTGLTSSWTLTSYSAGSSLAFVNGYTPGNCSGDIIFINSGGNTATRYTLNTDNNLGASNGYNELIKFLSDSTWGTAGCGQHESQRNFFGTTTAFTIAGNPPSSPNGSATPSGINGGSGTNASAVVHKGDACNSGADCKNGVCQKDGGACQNDSCADLSASPFSWFLCPGLDIAEKFSNALLNIFESQLSFTVGSLNGSKTCQQLSLTDPNACQNKVKQAWTIIRDLSSAVLVIVLLLMVISQAVSWGLFDAYTIKKMLPRIIVAVILMQISWDLVAWIIGLVNDAGKGLADLMYFPFGGSSNLDLGSLLANANIGNSTGSSVTWGLVAILATLVGTILAVAALPTLVFFVITAVFSLLVGIISLMFRKILIIMCLIFAPLALLAWILPGTQNYFKLWKDNLTKALLMFPLVVAIVAAGRIFAYITGTQDTGVGSVVLNFIFIMVGYFGPLFILPKTFKWGGSIMSSVGGTIQNVMKPASEKTAGAFKGAAERYQGEKAKDYNPEAGWRNRTLRRIQSGHIIPSVPGLRGAAKRSQRLTIQKGDKWSGEEDEMGLALIKRKGEKAMAGYMTDQRNSNGEQLSASRFRRNAAGQYLDENGKITDNENEAREVATAEEIAAGNVARKNLTGVAAMKQMWVDLAEDGDKFERKMAIRQLTATASWPEVQGSFTRSGKRVIDTDDWARSITTSPEDYPRTLRSRVDSAPHVVEAGEKAAEQDRGIARERDDVEARNIRSQERVKYAIEKQMSNEDFATQSDGFWQEAARMASLKGADGNLLPQSEEIGKLLRARFEKIKEAGPTAQQSMLGHLAGGSVRNEVDAILGGQGLAEFLPGSNAGRRGPGAPTTTPPSDEFGGEGVTLGHEDNTGPRIITPDDPNFRPPGPGDLPR